MDEKRSTQKTGAGSEAAEGLHNAQQGSRDESDPTGLSGRKSGDSPADGGTRSGSEPLAEDGDQHRSGYGGAGGAPQTSSDSREPPRPR